MNRRAALLAVATTLAITTGASTWLVSVDYSDFPLSPSEVAQQVTTAKVDLAAAITTAQESAGGIASSAEVKFHEDGTTWVEVLVASPGSVQKVIVSGGEVTETSLASPWLPGDVVKGRPTKTDSGLLYYDIRVGDGAQPAGPTTTVKVHYAGWLNDGTKFDSSYDRGQPIDFPLNGVISGWTEGVGSMRVGGKRKLLIPFDMAYGPAGRPPTIPARATLIFDVELIDIVSE